MHTTVRSSWHYKEMNCNKIELCIFLAFALWKNTRTHSHTHMVFNTLPGYVSIGQLAYRTAVFLSSSFKFTLTPFATTFMRPVHSGSLKFQFAALNRFIKRKFETQINQFDEHLITYHQGVTIGPPTRTPARFPPNQ